MPPNPRVWPTMSAEPVSRPWRRFLRFSVRGLIIIVLVIGGWLGWIVRSARIQRDAVAAIAKTEGVVSYHLNTATSVSWWPTWLVDRLGIDYFDHFDNVAFLNACSDADLKVRRTPCRD